MDKTLKEELMREEEKRLRRLRLVVDLAQAELMQSRLTYKEAVEIAERTRKAAIVLFPGKGDVFDLVCMPRLTRIIRERFRYSYDRFSSN